MLCWGNKMHTCLIFLPAAAYFLLTLIFSRRSGMKGIPEALVKGHLVLFTFIAVSTEILSVFHAITFSTLLIGWLLFLSVCFIATALFIYRRKQDFSFPLLGRLTPLTKILVGAIAFILATTFATAVLYPPNNWDSMMYHMSRVAHWISNNNVSFYPTAIPEQNYPMPLAEFAIMHAQILTAGDLYANLVQWVSFLVLICLGLLVGAELGLSNGQQLISAIVVATLPMAILQASSTQNDLVVSSFVMSFGIFMLRIRKNLSADNLIFAAAALGLALLTKGTAYLYCAAIGTSLAIPVLLASGRTYFLKVSAALSAVIIVALLLNTGHFWRNYQLYRHPLSTESQLYRNEDMTAATLVSGVVRNGVLHLGTPSRRINWYLDHAMQVALGSQSNNPKTTWPSTRFEVLYSRHEDAAGNLIHMLLALICLVSLPMLWYQRRHMRTIWYTIGVMLGAVLYCWILKWQPWASRLHTPLFVMAAPLLAMTITSGIGVRKRIFYMILLCIVVYSLPFTLVNKSRPLISHEWNRKDRMELYFQNRPELFSGYRDAINIVKEATPQEVGLYLGPEDWEYPFWAFALLRTGKNQIPMTFRHVGVSNPSKNINRDVLLPIYVIATTRIENWEHVANYAAVYNSAHVSVFKKSEHNNTMHTEGNSAALNYHRLWLRSLYSVSTGNSR
jgi:hypothetical protein